MALRFRQQFFQPGQFWTSQLIIYLNSLFIIEVGITDALVADLSQGGLQLRRPVGERFHLGLELEQQRLQLFHRVAVAQRVLLGRAFAQQLAVPQTHQFVFDAGARQRRQETRRLAVLALALVVRKQLERLPLSILEKGNVKLE